MAKKKQPQAVQAPKYTPYDVSGKIGADAFEVIGSDASSMEAIARPSISFMKDAWNRIRKSKVAIVCMTILALIILGAIFLPMICPFGYEQQNVAFQNKPIMSPDSVTGQMHIFGTDSLGRDVFARVWYGARISLTIAIAVALIDCFVGVIYGGVSGYFGGAVDTVMMRILEIISGSLSDHRYPSDDRYGQRVGDYHCSLFTYRVDRYGPSGKRPGSQPEGAGVCYRSQIHGCISRPYHR